MSAISAEGSFEKGTLLAADRNALLVEFWSSIHGAAGILKNS
jgi:hypothetical protein